MYFILVLPVKGYSTDFLAINTFSIAAATHCTRHLNVLIKNNRKRQKMTIFHLSIHDFHYLIKQP